MRESGAMFVRRLVLLAAFAAMLGATAGAQSVPQFTVDAAWPKPLPNNWLLGQVGGIFADNRDHVWVFQRPRSLTEDERGATLTPPRSICCAPAPPVMEFDQAGNLVQAWGGPHAGYDWPASEHGIAVDTKGFVWLAGSGKGDGTILKFRRDGTFVMQIGHPGPINSSDTTHLGQPADMWIDEAANELYVADGYGNHRVAVLDADTGEIKRIWGAYGKPPTDDKLPNYTRDSPQFANPVHCIGLSKDGLVYVCDRMNNRVQVFKKDGTFVRQYVIDPATKGSGSSWGLAFSPLDKKQNYFVLIDGTNNVIDTVRVKDGTVVGTTGGPGREVGEFHWVHAAKFDSRGNLYTGEVDTGKRLQKWVPAE